MSQPAPKKTDTPEVWPMVVADVRGGRHDSLPPYWAERLAVEMEARNDFGIKKYGMAVRVENGRDPLRDAMDEALDLCCYTRQQCEKTQHTWDWETHRMAVRMAARIQWRMALRDAEESL